MPFNVIGEKTKIAKPQHHTSCRGKMKKIMETDCRDNGEQKKEDHGHRPVFHLNIILTRLGIAFTDGQHHYDGRNQPVDQCGNKKNKKFQKLNLSPLPNHESCDIPKR